MSDFQIKCDNKTRKKLLQDPEETINGINYIEVKRVRNPDIQKSYSNSNNNNNYDAETGSNVSTSEKTTSTSISNNNNNNNSNSILLLLFLFKEQTTSNTIKKENFIILGGTRIRDIGIKLAGRANEVLEDLNENE